MHNSVDSLFENLWADYVSITPSAQKVHELLGQGQNIINDHVAFRTFNHDKVNLQRLAAHFEALGYRESGDYHFAEKRLDAKHYQHTDASLPKVFISELRCQDFSPELQAVVARLVEETDVAAVNADNFLYSGRHWRLSLEEYRMLAAESEYAGWLAAWGFRANHFTVSVNALRDYEELAEVNQTLKDAGFVLNTSGGEIKGGKDVFLAQSSTMADKIELDFDNGRLTIPSCFYEFAQRYPMASGGLYQGFVEASADKIFESTNQ